MAKATQAAKTDDKALTVTSPAPLQTNDLMIDFSADANSGLENLGLSDLGIPFVLILQGLSPQCREGDPKYIDGAKAGLLFNNLSLKLVDSRKADLKVIPCAYNKKWVEWKPRESGGGWVGQDDTDVRVKDCSRSDKGQFVLPNGNLLVETAYHYVVIVYPDDSFERVVIGMSSTQLKKSRRWNSQMIALKMEQNGQFFTPPSYSQLYPLSVEVEAKNNNSWFGWKIGNPTPINDRHLYEVARQFSKDVTAGVVSISRPEDSEVVNDSSSAAHDHF